MEFDSVGLRRRRIDQHFSYVSLLDAPFRPSLTELLTENSDGFLWQITLDDLPPLRLNWVATTTPSAAIAKFHLDDQPAALSLFLSGHDRPAEHALIQSLTRRLASLPRSTFRGAFDAFLVAAHRPLIASIRFGPADRALNATLILSVERSLCSAFFHTTSGLDQQLPPAKSA